MTERCEWAGSDPLYVAYHDEEWGVPLHDDRRLFEFLLLEGAQAGLSWITILKKRENYREAFDGFDPERIARYRPARLEKLLANPGIVRNRLKVKSAVTNAKAFLEVRDEFGSFDRFIWRFVDGETKRNAWRSLKEIPATTPDSRWRVFGCAGSPKDSAFILATGRAPMVNTSRKIPPTPVAAP